MSSVLQGVSAIPVVDFAKFLDGSRKQEVADAIVKSFKDTGFVCLVNHGRPQDKIDAMFEWSKRFFSQPMDVKMLAPHPASGSHHRGYSAPGVEKVLHRVFDAEEIAQQRAAVMDVKENFECGREDDLLQPNIWLPEGVLPGFKEVCLDFYWDCREAQLDVFRAIAVGLHIPEDYFSQTHRAADNQLRLLHYPSVPTKDLDSGHYTRIGAHADYGSITLLFQDHVGGLEVEDPNNPGEFLAVQPVDGALIVNAGDFLMRWSNDTIRSAVHRVRAPPGLVDENGMTPERYSIPYFCAPVGIRDLQSVVDCIPGTYSDDRPKKYDPISPLKYIMDRLAANY